MWTIAGLMCARTHIYKSLNALMCACTRMYTATCSDADRTLLPTRVRTYAESASLASWPREVDGIWLAADRCVHAWMCSCACKFACMQACVLYMYTRPLYMSTQMCACTCRLDQNFLNPTSEHRSPSVYSADGSAYEGIMVFSIALHVGQQMLPPLASLSSLTADEEESFHSLPQRVLRTHAFAYAARPASISWTQVCACIGQSAYCMCAHRQHLATCTLHTLSARVKGAKCNAAQLVLEAPPLCQCRHSSRILTRRVTVMAYVVMAYVGMGYVVMAFISGSHKTGYSYGLHSYGL